MDGYMDRETVYRCSQGGCMDGYSHEKMDKILGLTPTGWMHRFRIVNCQPTASQLITACRKEKDTRNTHACTVNCSLRAQSIS